MSNLGTHVLLVDDDHTLRTILARVLSKAGLSVSAVASGAEALDLLQRGRRFDTVITDLVMPGMSGTELLPRIRQLDLDVPVIILTGNGTLETAILALEYGGFRYLQKPVENARLIAQVTDAAAHHRLQLLKRKALEICEAGGALLQEVDALEERFERALDKLWIAFQPIVRWPANEVFGYEALVRSSDSDLPNPGLLFDAAERLGRVQELGMRIRDLVSECLPKAPPRASIFINLHALDLMHDSLYLLHAPLAPFAERVVFEVTERASLQRIDDLRARISRLRDLGFRIAVDDLGAGYAGLSSFSQLEPDIVKLDMSLVRGIDASPSKAALVRSMVQVCTQELRMSVVCEGVETAAERDTLHRLGAELLQGYLFAKPERGFREL
ncbi:MAG TPA: EAL domain-containing response regulator [Polyangiaceae bacterium]|nr:EAL domain-containing response regulator [Polyangiaceae bacterium]